MGLSIGIMKVEYLERPDGAAYKFAQHMAEEGAMDAYMFGDGGSWIPFTQRQVLELLDVFAARRGLSAVDRRLVVEWLMELPWIGGVAGRAAAGRRPRQRGRLSRRDGQRRPPRRRPHRAALQLVIPRPETRSPRQLPIARSAHAPYPVS